MFLLNSCLDLFAAPHSRGDPLSLSYGVNLPSSLTTLLPLALEYSSHLPVSVCGTGIKILTRSFSWQCDIDLFTTLISFPITTCCYATKHLTQLPTHCLDAHFQPCASLASCVPPLFKQILIVQESQPVIHRLRLSASA